MVLAGALFGLAGVALSIGSTGTNITNSVDAGVGFDAITVALLGRASPAARCWPGCCSARCRPAASRCWPTATCRPRSSTVLQSLIVLFIAAPALIQAIFRLRASRGGGASQLAKGWNG